MTRKRLLAPGALRLAGTAAVGVLAGHFLGYRIVFPGSPQRHAILIETGHGYFPMALRFGAMLAVIAGAATLARGYARAKAGGYDAPEQHVTTAKLALVQIGAFIGLEFMERLVSGVPFHHFLLPILVAGALAQVAIAAVGAALIALLYRAGEAIGREFGPDGAAGVSPMWCPAARSVRPSRSFDAPRPIRGPPSLLVQSA